jgi:uncharacterized membrane protein YdjX (TVP38/TMEM64 family)
VEPARLRLAVFAALVLGLFIAATASGSLPTADDVRDWGEGLGWAGPLAFIPAAACGLCLFVPGPVLAGAAGLLFGTAGGTPIALTFIVLGAVMQMSISRYLAGDAAAALLPERVKRFDRFIEQRGFWAVFYMRLAPAIPYNLVNYGAGLTSLKVRAIDDLGSPEAKVAIALLVVMAVTGALLARHQLAAERSA